MTEFSLHISEYLDAYDQDHTAVTVYIISVHNLKTNEMYDVQKRYSDFLNLHTSLCKTYPELKQFHFPRKTILHTPGDYVKTYRKEAFNYYLQVCIKIIIILLLAVVVVVVIVVVLYIIIIVFYY
jgi:hypothetical protein